MKHSHNLLTPAQSLLRSLELTLQPRSPPNLSPRRHFCQASPQLATFQIPSRSRLQRPDKLDIYTRDEKINTAFVCVKQPDGSIGPEEPLSTLLRRINRSSETIVQLSKLGERDAAVVEITQILDLRRRLRQQEDEVKQRQQATRAQKPKQIELNWAISEHDLGMKLKQLEQFVSEGKKVEILLAGKKRARKATMEEAQTVLQRIRERLVEIDAKEIAPMEGVVLRQAVLIVKSKRENAAKGESQVMDEDGDAVEDGRLAARKAREEKRATARAKQDQEKQRKEEEQQKLLKEFPDWNQPKAKESSVGWSTREHTGFNDRFSFKW